MGKYRWTNNTFHKWLFRGPETIYANPGEGDWQSSPFMPNKQYKKRETLADLSKEQWLDLEFDGGYGSHCPVRVTLWTDKNIHFNYEYDGADFVITKPRNPPGIEPED